MWLRSGTSDFDVFQQVLLRLEYAAVDLPDAKRIVDAGGNIGLTSFYFLERYPDATIVMIEPDHENFDAAIRNLAAFGSRCVLRKAALWSGRGTVAVNRGQYRDGRHWATQVAAENSASGNSVESITVSDVLHDQGWPSLDILKMDVEGAEREIFGADTNFLSSTRCCVIELHGAECERAFESAIAPHPNRLVRERELTIVKFLEPGETTSIAMNQIETIAAANTIRGPRRRTYPTFVHRVLRVALPIARRLPGTWRVRHHVLNVKRVAFPDRPVCVRNRFGLRMLVSPNDLIGRQIFYNGAWESRIATHFYELVRPGDAVLDVGANVGQYTLLAAAKAGPQGRVFSVEPSSLADTHLQRSIAANGFTSVHVLKMAAWSSNMSMMLQPGEADNCGTAEVIEYQDGIRGVPVPARRIAEVLKEHDCTHVDVIKLDIEGAELPALRGMAELFDERPPRAVYCEMLESHYTPETREEFLQFFYSRGYRGQMFAESDPHPFDPSMIVPGFESMLLFTKE